MAATLYLLCGLSFCGKSTMAAAIAQQTGSVVVSLDAINTERGLYGGLGIGVEDWARSHQAALVRAEEALSAGGSVVIDDTNCFRFLRDDFRSMALRLDARFLLLYIDVPLPTLLARMRANAKAPTRPPITEEVFLDLLRKFEPPTPDEQPVVVPPDLDPATWVTQNIVPHHQRRVG